MTKMIPVIWVTVLFFTIASTSNFQQPQHVHIAYGDAVSKMIITWSTFNDTNQSVVLYGTEKQLKMSQKGASSKFISGGNEKRFQFIHRVDLDNLNASTIYFYLVGSTNGWSEIFSFSTMPDGEDWAPRLVVIGDMGNANSQSLARVEADTMAGMYDALIHVGDFAYDLSTDNGRNGDAYMQKIEPLAASLPYMTCVGNHENNYNFSDYRSRFNMPNDNRKMFYSFNMGPVHFISISTEYLYFPYGRSSKIFEQHEWLKRDLMEANSPANRTKRPWVVTVGHRPMYCSNNDNDDCTSDESLVRVGVPLLNIPGFEDIFYEYGVDFSMWAHEHSYERLWPIYNNQIKNGSYQNPYVDPEGITHIITGSAGCSERHEYYPKSPPFWSAFHSSDYGYTRLTFSNKTHLYVEQVSDDKGGMIIDKFTLVKNHHGSYKKIKKQ